MGAAELEAAKALGSGSAQLILAAGVVLFGLIAVWLGRTLYAEIKACSAQLLDITAKKIESDNKLADAIESSSKVMEAALVAMRRP